MNEAQKNEQIRRRMDVCVTCRNYAKKRVDPATPRDGYCAQLCSRLGGRGLVRFIGTGGKCPDNKWSKIG